MYLLTDFECKCFDYGHYEDNSDRMMVDVTGLQNMGRKISFSIEKMVPWNINCVGAISGSPDISLKTVNFRQFDTFKLDFLVYFNPYHSADHKLL